MSMKFSLIQPIRTSCIGEQQLLVRSPLPLKASFFLLCKAGAFAGVLFCFSTLCLSVWLRTCTINAQETSARAQQKGIYTVSFHSIWHRNSTIHSFPIILNWLKLCVPQLVKCCLLKHGVKMSIQQDGGWVRNSMVFGRCSPLFFSPSSRTFSYI